MKDEKTGAILRTVTETNPRERTAVVAAQDLDAEGGRYRLELTDTELPDGARLVEVEFIDKLAGARIAISPMGALELVCELETFARLATQYAEQVGGLS